MTELDDSAVRRLDGWARAQDDVAGVWIFGSRARGDHRDDSDWDVAVLPSREAGEEGPLRRRLRWIVEVAAVLRAPAERLDLVTLDDAPVLLAQRVAQEGELVADNAPDIRTAFVESTFHRAQEAMHLRRIAMRARAERYRVAE